MLLSGRDVETEEGSPTREQSLYLQLQLAAHFRCHYFVSREGNEGYEFRGPRNRRQDGAVA